MLPRAIAPLYFTPSTTFPVFGRQSSQAVTSVPSLDMATAANWCSSESNQGEFEVCFVTAIRCRFYCLCQLHASLPIPVSAAVRPTLRNERANDDPSAADYAKYKPPDVGKASGIKIASPSRLAGFFSLRLHSFTVTPSCFCFPAFRI